MGFSLAMFFEELQEIINNEEIDEQDRLDQLETAIESGRKLVSADICVNRHKEDI